MAKKRLHTSIIPKTRPNIPTEADFERADRHMAELLRVDAAVRSRVLSKFGGAGGIHDFHIFSGSAHCDAYIFMPLDRDLGSPLANTLREQVGETVLGALEAEGFGPRDTIVLRMEIDSHERVQRIFNGDYNKRFR